jgi:hypothetical protein
MDDIKQIIEEINQKIDFLMQKRLIQADFTPGSVKQRAMGEANLFINSGLSAARPTTPPKTSSGTFCYFETDTNKLYIWNGTAYKSTTLT